MLRHLNEDHVIPQPQFLEGFYRLMLAAEAMRGERRFAGCPSMADRLGAEQSITLLVP
jgi:hypothetical protein